MEFWEPLAGGNLSPKAGKSLLNGELASEVVYASLPLMRFNLFLVFTITFGFSSLLAEDKPDESGVAFREALYFSDVDRDYSTPQAVRVGGVVFVAAMTGMGESLEEQIRTVYMRLQSVLGNYGLTMADVAQERIYLKAGQNYEKAKSRRPLVYGTEAGPACTVVEVSGFETEGSLVSIELIAVANPDSE